MEKNWTDKSESPKEKGFYRVKVSDWDDEHGEVSFEAVDWFNGSDWAFGGYRQFIAAWCEKISVPFNEVPDNEFFQIGGECTNTTLCKFGVYGVGLQNGEKVFITIDPSEEVLPVKLEDVLNNKS